MIREVSHSQLAHSPEGFVKPRIPKWILLFSAAMLLAACSSDTSVLGPTSDNAQVQPVLTPTRSNSEAELPAGAPAPAPQKRRGRYAMAAS
jgi:uncharacterized lipoprotein